MLHLGIIGCGRVTTMFHLHAINNSKSWKLVGLADNNERRLKEVQKISGTEYTTTDYKQLLLRDDIQAVSINTPPKLHEQMVIDSLNAGKHVLCEKPLTQTVDSCQKIKDKQLETGKVVLPVHNYVFAPSFIKIEEKLKNGKIGQLNKISISFENYLQGYNSVTDFRTVNNSGILEDIMPHILSVLTVLAGDIKEIQNISWWCKSFNVCDNIRADLISESNVLIDCSLSWTKMIPNFKLILEGSQGKLMTELMLEPYKHTFENSTERITEKDRGLDWYIDLIQYKHPSFSGLYRHFAQLVENKVEQKITVDDEINMIKTIEKMVSQLTPEKRINNVK
ncbi:Gfo/Idh/MocA family oxidoreductase [Candidatus Bathyarchaeota archaeon]|nr:Gfo/Idh/MocA family oxidoreductase [Candidatus Bathyarchaeota archaeon]